MPFTGKLRFLGFALIFLLISDQVTGQSAAYFAQKAKDQILVNPDSALVYTDMALAKAANENNDSLLASIHLSRADAYRQIGMLKEWEDHLRLAAKINESVRDLHHDLLIHNLYGLLYMKKAQFDSAIHYFLLVRDKSLVQKDTVGIIKSYNNLGLIYSDIGDNDRAEEEYLMGIEYARLKKDSMGLQYLYNNLSNLYRHQKAFGKAIEYINYSIALAEQSNIVINAQRGYSNKGATYFQMQEFDEAEKALLKAASIAEAHTLKESLVKIYYHLAEVYIKTKRFSKAKANGNKVLSIAMEEKLTEDIKYGHEILYLVAKAEGDFDEALFQHEKYMEVRDSIFNVERAKSIAEIETKYQTVQKDLELQKLASDIEIMDKNKRLLRTRITFVSIGIALGLIAYFLYLSREEMQREKRQREEYTAGILLSRESERKELSKDLHDHIGQSLVLLNQSLDKGDVHASKQLTQSVLQDVRRVSRDLYPWQIEKLGLEAALKDLIQTVEKTTDILLTFDIDPLDEIVDRERGLQIYRILQECLNNLVKHSKAKSARISLHRENGHIHLVIQDNGSGFDQRVEFARSKSLGLMTLRDRAQTLNGKLEIESVIGKGSKFSFSFPAV